MFDKIKPGHVLKFGVDPATIKPITPNGQQNLAARTLWPGQNNLGMVQVISHPTGPIAAVADAVVKELRTGISLGRMASYSAMGRAQVPVDRVQGGVVCGFTGYGIGMSYYTEGDGAIVSSEFSGCLLAAYRENGHRRVAHVYAGSSKAEDCKLDFLRGLLSGNGTQLIGWFRPFMDESDGAEKFKVYQWLDKKGFCKNHYHMLTFGVITGDNRGYSFTAFKPHGIANEGWVVTKVKAMTMDARYAL